MPFGWVAPKCTRHGRVRLLVFANAIGRVGIERGLEMALVELLKKLNVVREKLLIPPERASATWSVGDR